MTYHELDGHYGDVRILDHVNLTTLFGAFIPEKKRENLREKYNIIKYRPHSRLLSP
jgi:hypothetical protein